MAVKTNITIKDTIIRGESKQNNPTKYL